jgi:hypothetical protein
MGFIKQIVLLLLMPVITHAQTIHLDSNRIVYKGTVKQSGINKDELYARAKMTILGNVTGSREVIVTDNNEKGMIAGKGSIKLASPYHIIKKVEYIFELSVDNEKYEYRIDSVYIKQVERGGKTVRISSEDLLKGMDVSGAGSANTEKQLNEIDMDFQKLLDLVNADMKKIPVVKNRTE